MTPAELRKIIKRIGLSQVQCAKTIGVDPRTLRRWIAGNHSVPKPVQMLLEFIAKKS